MRRALWIVAGIVTLGLAWRRHCRTGEGHRTRRHPLGGQVCETCGRAFEGLEDAGLMDGDRVSVVRAGAVRGSGWNGVERSAR